MAGASAVLDLAHRTVRLPGGDVVDVRPMVPADADAVRGLWSRLSEEDRHRRFFSASVPGPGFAHRWAAVAEEGGFALVAVTRNGARAGAPPSGGGDPAPSPPGDRRPAGGRLVAEAGYAVLDDGDGELGISVDSDWRGWLGSYLLDALLDVAAARGVRNLQAVVLMDNRAMLALARTRGYATAGHEDLGTIRITIGTGHRPPGWAPAGSRPRVLVEAPGGRWHAADLARDAGLGVLTCPGPATGCGPGCPGLSGRGCPLADEADIIIFHPDPDSGLSASFLGSQARGHPRTPVVVESVSSPGRLPRLPAGCLRLAGHLSDAQVVAFLERLKPPGTRQPAGGVTAEQKSEG